MQWPLNDVPADCTFESWLTLEGAVVKCLARLRNARTDKTLYPARLQELPALYGNGNLTRLLSYTGCAPFTHAPVSPVPRPTGTHPWSFWLGTEGWAAAVDDTDHGLGLVTPNRIHFTGGTVSGPSSTAYLAGQAEEVLDHNIVYDFAYEVVVGHLHDIRARAAKHRPQTTPTWTFTSDRQGWHAKAATDSGWPIQEAWNLRLTQDDPHLLSPYTFWQANEAPCLEVEAAISGPHTTAAVMWQRHGEQSIQADNNRTFPITADGTLRTYRIRLADSPSYQGAMVRLRLDPAPSGHDQSWTHIKRITFTSK
jgi:hypothetical protein